jgi:hypothetical protein
MQPGQARHLAGRCEPDDPLVLRPEEGQDLFQLGALQPGVVGRRRGVMGRGHRPRDGRRGGRLPGEGRCGEGVPVDLQRAIEAGNRDVGVEDLRRGDLAIDEPPERLQHRAGAVQPKEDEVVGALDQPHLQVGREPWQRGSHCRDEARVAPQGGAVQRGDEVVEPAGGVDGRAGRRLDGALHRPDQQRRWTLAHCLPQEIPPMQTYFTTR